MVVWPSLIWVNLIQLWPWHISAWTSTKRRNSSSRIAKPCTSENCQGIPVNKQKWNQWSYVAFQPSFLAHITTSSGNQGPYASQNSGTPFHPKKKSHGGLTKFIALSSLARICNARRFHDVSNIVRLSILCAKWLNIVKPSWPLVLLQLSEGSMGSRGMIFLMYFMVGLRPFSRIQLVLLTGPWDVATAPTSKRDLAINQRIRTYMYIYTYICICIWLYGCMDACKYVSM